MDAFEAKYIDGEQVIYQEDLEKLLGETLDVPGAYFNYEGGGRYWNCYGNDPRVYYYRAGCQKLLNILNVSHEEKEKIMKYFNKTNNDCSQKLLSDEDLFNLICKLDDIAKKKVVIYIDELLNEQKKLDDKYNTIINKYLTL